MLQAAGQRFLVTLNPHRAVRGTPLRCITYEHPLFTPASSLAQRRHGGINGADRLYFAGAYWGWGFHEDGVRSAVQAVKPLTTATIPGVGAYGRPGKAPARAGAA